MTRYRYPWIVLADTGELRCERCGRSYQPTMPASVNVYLAICKAFTSDHRRCKPR